MAGCPCVPAKRDGPREHLRGHICTSASAFSSSLARRVATAAELFAGLSAAASFAALIRHDCRSPEPTENRHHHEDSLDEMTPFCQSPLPNRRRAPPPSRSITGRRASPDSGRNRASPPWVRTSSSSPPYHLSLTHRSPKPLGHWSAGKTLHQSRRQPWIL